jgi:hypothetical protein
VIRFLRDLHWLRLRLLLRNWERPRCGQLDGGGQVGVWCWNRCFFDRRRDQHGRTRDRFSCSGRGGVNRGGELALEVSDLPLERGVLPRILFRKLV